MAFKRITCAISLNSETFTAALALMVLMPFRTIRFNFYKEH